jgi:hypothetical protein
MKKSTLIFNFITGEITEVEREDIANTLIADLHDEYRNEFVAIGRDNFEGHNVWFIKFVNNSSVTRQSLERQVYNYLHK